MLNQYRRRYLARLQTLLKEFYELADEAQLLILVLKIN